MEFTFPFPLLNRPKGSIVESRRILAWNVALLRMEVAVLHCNTIFKICYDFFAFLLVQSLKGL
jgi:hypothetical protein